MNETWLGPLALGVFWASAGLIAYTYALYPLLQALLAWLKPRPFHGAGIEPRVSLVICAHNEAASIDAKLRNVFALDYPAERLQVIVASDGSTDATDAIVRGWTERGVRLLSLPRMGKIPALNAAVAEAEGDVLVFSDANSMYAPDALRALLAPLTDPSVGGVAGDQRYADAVSDVESGGERAYWSLDRQLKRWQSRSGSVTSATGAIYAIRRHLFETVPPAVTDDFFVSTAVVAAGYRLVFEPRAVAFEPPARTSGAEFRRKVRVATRGLRGVLLRRCLLDPRRTGFYAPQLLAHKILRRLVGVPLLLLFAASPCVWSEGGLYRLAFLAQLCVYGPALAAAAIPKLRGASKLFSVPFFFCMVNVAALVAASNVLRGRRIDAWNPQRSPAV